MSVGVHVQFWLTILLSVAALVILLARGRNRGEGWLIAFLILYSITYAGYYVPGLLDAMEVLPAAWRIAYTTSLAYVVLPVAGVFSWLFFLTYVVVRRPTSRESVAVLKPTSREGVAVPKALVSPPSVVRGFKCSTCGQEWGSNYCPACCHTIDCPSDNKIADIPAAPTRAVVGTTRPSDWSVQRVRRAQAGQRLLIVAIAVNMLLSGTTIVALNSELFLGLLPRSLSGLLMLVLPLLLIELGSVVATFVGLFKVGSALEIPGEVLALLFIAMFVPLISLVTLLVMNAKATKFLRRSGYKVGLLGAHLAYTGEASHAG